MGQRPIGGRLPSILRNPHDHAFQDPDCRRAFAAVATSAFSQVPWEFNPGMAYMYVGPGKCRRWPWRRAPKNHDAMMKNAKKVPNNTVFFMDKGQLYSTSGMLDPTGNFYLP